MIKNIILDVGGVLADPRSGHWFITNNFYNIVNKDLVNDKELRKSLNNNYFLLTQVPKNEKEEHKMFSDFYYKVLSDIKYKSLNKELADKLAEDCVYNDEKFIFYPDVQDNIKRLSEKYDLYIISNAWPSSLRVLKNIGIDKYFKGIVISSMYSSVKEESLFDIFLDNYNVKPQECIYIDDRNHILEKAKEYGFNLQLMNRNDEMESTEFKTIYSLEEIY